jgi:outer membrane protein OmpA-like peptidoglycan-associated protein
LLQQKPPYKLENYTFSRGYCSLIIGIILLLLGIFNMGCSPLTRTQKGAAIGAGAGATVGALIGKAAGNAGLGAIIGGAVGGTAGAYIGSKIQGQGTELKITVPGAILVPHDEGMLVKFDTGIMFDAGSTDLKPDAQTNLKNFAAVLRSNPLVNVSITGHTDTTETNGNSMDLSLRRAEAVKNYLIADSISTSRIATSAKGNSEPANGNGTIEAAAQNRRVEIVILTTHELKSQVEQSSQNSNTGNPK